MCRASNSGSEIIAGVDILSLARTGGWTTVTSNWPQAQYFDSPVYAGGRIFAVANIWCGGCSSPAFPPLPILANARTLARTPVDLGAVRPSLWLWNGRALVVAELGGYGKAAPRGRLGQLAAWDPVSRRRSVLPAAPGRPALGADPVFVADRLLVLTPDGGLLALGQRS